MSTPYVLILDEYGYYATATNFGRLFGKRSLAKQIDIQERWDNRRQKRNLNAALGFDGSTPKTRKI